MCRGPVSEHCPAHRFCFGVCGGKVGRLRDFPFGIGDDDACLLLDRGAELGVAACYVGAGGEQPEQCIGHGWLARAVAAQGLPCTPLRQDACRPFTATLSTGYLSPMRGTKT